MELAVVFGAIAAMVMIVATQAAAVLKTRAVSAHDAEYRQLLREVNEAQQRVAESLDRTVAEIASLRTRIESTERLLQEVG